MTYLEPQTKSEHCQTSTMESFAKTKLSSVLSYILQNQTFYFWA